MGNHKAPTPPPVDAVKTEPPPAPPARNVAPETVRGALRMSRMPITLEYLRQVTIELRSLRYYDRGTAENEALAFYRRDVDRLSGGASALLDVLDKLDLTALAIKEDIVDRDVATRYLRTVIGPERTVRLEFLAAFREACGDELVYENLYRLAASMTGGDS